MSRRRKFLIIAAVALVVVILAPLVRHYQLRAAVTGYLAQLEAKGEPMDLAQVLPPPVPPDRDCARSLRKAFALMDAEKNLFDTNFYGIDMMKSVAPGKAMISWQQPEDRESDVTNSWRDLTAAVAQNEKIFALLRQTVAKPDADFGIQYSRGVADISFTNLCLMDSKRAAQWLSVAVMCDLRDGRTQSAVENLRAMLALLQVLRSQRLVISELVRIAIAQIAVTATWEILQSPDLTDAQLAQLQHDWADFNFLQSAREAVEMERVIGRITLDQWRGSYSEIDNVLHFGLSGGGESAWDTVKTEPEVLMWRYWWSYSDELRAQKGYEALLDAMRLAQTNGCFLDAIQYQESKLDQLGMLKLAGQDFEAPDLHSMLSQSAVTLSGITRRIMIVTAAQQMAVTAIALKRFQLKFGHYPAAL